MGVLGRVRGKLRGIRHEIRERRDVPGSTGEQATTTNGATATPARVKGHAANGHAANGHAAPKPIEIAPEPVPEPVETAPEPASEPLEVPTAADDGDATAEGADDADRFRGGSKVAADGSSNSVATSQFSSFAAAAAAAARGETTAALYADTSSTNLAAYAARAAALGRSGTALGGEGINEGEFGQFWGPVDNESARSKAEGEVLDIDQDECISCGTCVENTELVFVLPADEGATAHVIAQEGPMDLVQDAIEACPVTCISWVATGEEWQPTD